MIKETIFKAVNAITEPVDTSIRDARRSVCAKCEMKKNQTYMPGQKLDVCSVCSCPIETLTSSKRHPEIFEGKFGARMVNTICKHPSGSKWASLLLFVLIPMLGFSQLDTSYSERVNSIKDIDFTFYSIGVDTVLGDEFVIERRASKEVVKAFINTDNQNLSLTDTKLALEASDTVDLAPYINTTFLDSNRLYVRSIEEITDSLQREDSEFVSPIKSYPNELQSLYDIAPTFTSVATNLTSTVDSIFAGQTTAIVDSGTVADIRYQGLSTTFTNAQNVAIWLKVDKPDSLVSFQVQISSPSTPSFEWIRSDADSENLIKNREGWYCLKWKSQASNVDGWGSVDQVRIVITSNETIKVTWSPPFVEKRDKAKIMIINDGLYTQGWFAGEEVPGQGDGVIKELSDRGYKWIAALSPARVGVVPLVADSSEVRQVYNDGVELSYHSFNSEITSDKDYEFHLARMIEVFRWFKVNNYPYPRFRAAVTQNDGPFAKNLIGVLGLRNTATGDAFTGSTTTFPFVDRGNVSRITIQGQTPTTLDQSFDNLKKFRQLGVFYTHAIRENSSVGIPADATVEEWDYFLSKVDTGVNEGWLEVIQYADYVKQLNRFGLRDYDSEIYQGLWNRSIETFGAADVVANPPFSGNYADLNNEPWSGTGTTGAISRTGSVNIGTSTGSEKLNVNGNVYVSGNAQFNNSQSQIIGGFGANTTAGVQDWNDVSNARSGFGVSLLNGTDANGPGGSALYHPVSFEYSSKNGSGNLTTLAIPYNDDNMYFRRRLSAVWSSWVKMWNAANDGAGSGLEADLLDGQEGGYYYSPTNVPSYSTLPDEPWSGTGTTSLISRTGSVSAGTLNLTSTAVGVPGLTIPGTALVGRVRIGPYSNFASLRGTGTPVMLHNIYPSPTISNGYNFETSVTSSSAAALEIGGGVGFRVLYATNTPVQDQAATMIERFKVSNTGLVTISQLANSGDNLVMANNAGNIIPASWSDFAATSNVELGTNLINNDGDTNEGLSFATNGDATQQGAFNTELPDFRASSTTVTYGANPRKVVETYAGDGDDLTGVQVPHTRSYTPTAHYSSRDVAGSIGTTQYGWSVLDAARGLSNQTETEAHFSFNVPSNALIGIEVTGFVKDAAGVPHYFKVGAAATEGDTGATGSSEEIALGMVTADWYTSAAGNVAFKVIAPTGSDWSNAVIEIRKTYSSSLASLATQIEFRNTNL